MSESQSNLGSLGSRVLNSVSETVCGGIVLFGLRNNHRFANYLLAVHRNVGILVRKKGLLNCIIY